MDRAARKRVLIIDDEIDLCLLLKSYFLKKNYDVRISHSFHDGMHVLHESNPEIIFIDNNLPDGSGWKAASEISAACPKAYINFMSAYNPAPPPDLPAGLHYSIYEKPISFSDLDKHFVGNSVQ